MTRILLRQHGNLIFAIALKNYPEIQVKYFKSGKETINFIQNLSTFEKKKVFLLTDYELINQGINGLDIIEKTGIERSILTTSHHAKKDIRTRASKIGTKILPKRLVPEISITVDETINYDESLEKIDLILVDDDEKFAQTMMLTIFAEWNTEYYLSPTHFLKNSSKYAKDTKICLDKNFVGDMNGIALAKKLHEQGFTQIFLVSGERLKKKTCLAISPSLRKRT